METKPSIKMHGTDNLYYREASLLAFRNDESRIIVVGDHGVREWDIPTSTQRASYQIVAVTLRDGRRVEDVAIIESHIIGSVRGYADIPFEPEDIVGVELTHRRWLPFDL